MSIEMCIECDNPTGKAGACEDSLYVGDDGPFCETCFEWKGMMAEHKAVVEKLEAEIARLKEETKLLPELTQKAERYTEIWNIATQARSVDAMQLMEATWRKWEELRKGTTISIEQAQEASRQAGKAAAVHTVRACAQWLRINGWHNSVRDTAIEMERLMMEDVNRTYGTP